MGKTMRAFVMKEIGKVGVMEKPVPEDPGPAGAIIQTTNALICTSDTHTVKGALGNRHDLTLGHEAVGRVSKVGKEVKRVREGDRVAVNAITPCYQCVNCLRGYSSQCQEMLGGWKFANIKDGSFAEFFHVNQAEANLAIIPDSIPDDVAVYAADMMSTGFAGAEQANLPIGGSVAIFAHCWFNSHSRSQASWCRPDNCRGKRSRTKEFSPAVWSGYGGGFHSTGPSSGYFRFDGWGRGGFRDRGAGGAACV